MTPDTFTSTVNFKNAAVTTKTYKEVKEGPPTWQSRRLVPENIKISSAELRHVSNVDHSPKHKDLKKYNKLRYKSGNDVGWYTQSSLITSSSKDQSLIRSYPLPTSQLLGNSANTNEVDLLSNKQTFIDEVQNTAGKIF
jgi:hypothetical protein